MNKSISILDKDYLNWVKELALRYRNSQIKASIKVNVEQLKYNWILGRDIVEMKVEDRWGEGVLNRLSNDLKKEMPGVEGLSVTNLRYCKRFYLLYPQHLEVRPQLEGEWMNDYQNEVCPQLEGGLDYGETSYQIGGIFEIPWGHHKLILDKVKGGSS